MTLSIKRVVPNFTAKANNTLPSILFPTGFNPGNLYISAINQFDLFFQTV